MLLLIRRRAAAGDAVGLQEPVLSSLGGGSSRAAGDGARGTWLSPAVFALCHSGSPGKMFNSVRSEGIVESTV